jgi:hypothetical protein
MVRSLALAALLLAVTAQGAIHAPRKDADPQAVALQLFKRLTGTPILLNDPRLAQMVSAIQSGDMAGAAAIATDDDHFYSDVVRDFASLMATRAETPLAPLDDFQATIIGATRDDLDARTLLTGNYLYLGNSSTGVSQYSPSDDQHYLDLETGHFSLKQVLVKTEPQPQGLPVSAGLLTSRGWASAHLIAGTNRRGVEYTFREFLCTPIQTWRDSGMPDFHVRRDVDRVPGGNPTTYQTTCRSCHALMDGMGGAYARLDFVNDTLTYMGPSGVASKMNKNSNVYPQGYMTLDDSWFNQATQHHNTSFGWRGPLSGNGVHDFGVMISNAKKFSSCMTTRVFREVCKREPDPSEASLIQGLADDFETGGYKLRSLFQKVAVTPACSN